MIIPIIGNHGSGKSYLVEQIAGCYESINLVGDRLKTTRNPIIMECSSEDTIGVAIIGYYMNDVRSGVDSGRFAGRIDEVDAWITSYAKLGWHVLFEGMLVASMLKRYTDMHAGGVPITFVHLDVTDEECVLSVEHRKSVSRRNKHTDMPVNMKVIASKGQAVQQAVGRLKELGIPVLSGDREASLRAVKGLLGL